MQVDTKAIHNYLLMSHVFEQSISSCYRNSHCMSKQTNSPTAKYILLRMREAVKSLSRCTYSWKMSNGEPLLAFATSSKLVVAIVDTICMSNTLHVTLLVVAVSLGLLLCHVPAKQQQLQAG